MVQYGDTFRSGDQLDFGHLHQNPNSITPPWIIAFERDREKAEGSTLEMPEGSPRVATAQPGEIEASLTTPNNIIDLSTKLSIRQREQELNENDFWRAA